MGEVFLAREEALERNVAIKLISGSGQTQARERFSREARAMASVEHPNVVRVYGFGTVNQAPYLTMEYIEGAVLGKDITAEGRFDVDEALRIARQIVEALEAAWEKGVIHRDIKPSNILLDRKGNVRVADFGLAKRVELASNGDLTQTGYLVGTPHYVSPEQARGMAVDFRSDIYSLGIMLWEMLAGKRPFSGTTPIEIVAKHLHEPLPPIEGERNDISAAVARLIGWMTDKDPDQRPSSHREMLEAIDAIRAETPATAATSITALQARSHRKRTARWVTIAAIIIAVSLLGALAGVRLFRDKGSDTGGPSANTGFTVVVSPFYGPDEDSIKEGRVMASLIEKEVARGLAGNDVTVIGIDEVPEPIRSHGEARAVAAKHGAAIVLWGEALALRGETEITPFITVASPLTALDETKTSQSQVSSLDLQDLEGLLESSAPQPLLLGAEAPNQIELRKTGASGIGDMVTIMAAIHALNSERNPSKALRILDTAPTNAETLLYRARAMLQLSRDEEAFESLKRAGAFDTSTTHAGALLGDLRLRAQTLLHLSKNDEALAVLQRAVELDPTDAAAQALLGDLHFADGRLEAAARAYRAATESGNDFTTQRAIFYDSKLYAGESYVDGTGRPRETAYLIARDPVSGTVVERYALPGWVSSFRPVGDALEIEWFDKFARATIRFSDGRFDRPVYFGPNWLLRMASMRSGWKLAENFAGELRDRDVDAPRFRPGPEPIVNLPKTQGELESALRAAMANDPTQPWHHFFLGQSLWAQQRTDEAQETWAQLLKTEFAGTPYYEWSWMAAYFERLGQPDWADRMFEKALSRRKVQPQPIEAHFDSERLVSAPFSRLHGGMRVQPHDPERAYQWLQRGREIAGTDLESGHLHTTIWASYFRKIGDAARESAELAERRKVWRHPLNRDRLGTSFHYLNHLLLALTVVAWIYLLRIVWRALRGREIRGGVVNWIQERAKMYLALSRWAQARVTMVLFGAAVGWFLLVPVLVGDLDEVALLIGLFLPVPVVAAFLILLEIGRHLRLSKADRWTGVPLALLLAVLLLAWVKTTDDLAALAGMPMTFMDSLGHQASVDHLESRLRNVDNDAVRYAAAVANHMAGNRERARELYATVEGHAGASANEVALARGDLLPPVPLSARQLAEALRPTWVDALTSVLATWNDALNKVLHLRVPAVGYGGGAVAYFRMSFGYGGGAEAIFWAATVTPVIVLAVIVLSLLRRNTGSRSWPQPKSSRGRVCHYLVPGGFDIDRGSQGLGWLAVFLMVLAAVVAASLARQHLNEGHRSDPETRAILSFEWSVINARTSPLPVPLDSFDRAEYSSDIFWSYPGAKIFFPSVALGGLLALAFHLWRIPAIRRFHREAQEPAAETS